MARRRLMQNYARWHIWLGWLVGVPLLLWTLSGLVMVARPIEEVRGHTLHIEHKPAPVRVQLGGATGDTLIREGKILDQRGRSVLIATFMDGSVRRIDLGAPGQTMLPPVDEAEARAAVRYGIRGGEKVLAVRLFAADQAPMDFRRPMAAWQVTLADDTHVYVGRDTGEIEAVRTRWWRLFDFMWGLHIMDLETREDTHHPFLVGFGIVALIGTLMALVLLPMTGKRKRKGSGKPAQQG